MPTIEFRFDICGSDGLPHTFIVMDNGAGDKHIYGFGPADGEWKNRDTCTSSLIR